MAEQEILKHIETILYNPETHIGNSFRTRFYYIQNNKGIFSNRTVELLLGLFQKLASKKEKDFFLEIINPAAIKIADPSLFIIPSKFQLMKSRQNIFKHQDFIFMFFVKNKNIEEALIFPCLVDCL